MYPAFHISTHVFEGPLDLLLGLIEKRKLFIGDIALANVADRFLEYVKDSEDLSIGQMAHFISIASILVLIKSKSLLPTLDLTEQEEESIEELETRLAIYQIFKNQGELLAPEFEFKSIHFKKHIARRVNPIFLPEEQLTIEMMRSSIDGVFEVLPKIDLTPTATLRATKTLEEVIQSISKRVMKTPRGSFKEYSSEVGHDKPEMIVGFLAVLELVKLGSLLVYQESDYGDIIFESKQDNDSTKEIYA